MTLSVEHDSLTCHVCGCPGLHTFAEFEQFCRVTSDCRSWPSSGKLAACLLCGCVQKVLDEAWHGEVARIYRDYALYPQGNGVEQAVFSGGGVSSTRSARLLAELTHHERIPVEGRLLDVGCGNGAFLREFRRIAPSWGLVGTELSDHYQSVVESIPGVERMHVGSPEDTAGLFDLVSLIHVLEHIGNPASFLRQLTRKLAPKGTFFIEVPDYMRNPFDLLIADHATHLSTTTVAYVMSLAGCSVECLATEWVPKELSVVVRPGECSGPQHGAPVDNSSVPAAVEERLRWLGAVAATGRRLADQKEFGLFGTAIAATWLFGELAGKVSFFVDEDPNRIGQSHLHRPVIAPAAIPPDAHVLIPLAPALAGAIAKRLGLRNLHLPPSAGWSGT